MNRLSLLAALAAAAGCSGDDSGLAPVHVDVTAPMPMLLSSTNVLAWDAAAGRPAWNDEVVPYEINMPLFSDYAVKYRGIYVPPEATPAPFDDAHVLDFPVGSVLIKSFVFPADVRAPTVEAKIIETRLLVHEAAGWVGYPYVWNDAQTDATLTPSGGTRTIDLVDATGTAVTANYLIPQKNQCSSCHARTEAGTNITVMTPLGPSARQLDREGQLARLEEAKFITGVPDLASITPAYDFRAIDADGVAAVPAADLDRAARDYLDANCSHCHNANGVQGMTSQLFLDHTNTDTFHLGLCKQPGSAGLGTGGFKYDIVPGNPDISVLAFRVTTKEPGAIMPLLGRSLVHARGVELIRAWIAAMPPSDPPNCGL